MKRWNQPEDNLYGYHDVTERCEETLHPERTVISWTARTLTSKSLPEIQRIHQGRRVVDGLRANKGFPWQSQQSGL